MIYNIIIIIIAARSDGIEGDSIVPSKRRVGNYPIEALLNAVESVKSGKMNYTEASTCYGVPRTTIFWGVTKGNKRSKNYFEDEHVFILQSIMLLCYQIVVNPSTCV